MNEKEKVYFPNLNGMRFFAAFVVIVSHLEQSLFLLGYKYKPIPIIITAELGVLLFFVLSGFLITYLLLSEENKTGSISIKQFYIRRILRIWPLYYTLILLAFFVLPNIGLFNMPILNENKTPFSLLLYFFFLPNLVLAYDIIIPYISHSWSVGVEEQFYLIWPVLMKLFKKKLVILISVIVVYIGIKIGLRYIYFSWESNKTIYLINYFWDSFKISAMAIGGIFAYLLHKKNHPIHILLIKYIKSIPLMIISLVVVFVIVFFNLNIPVIKMEINAFLFGIIIFNMSTNEKLDKFLENRILNYLGKISYGLYMYHVIAIVFCIKIFNYLGILHIESFAGMIFLLVITTLVAVLFAGISYHFMESKFIQMKILFSNILSGDNAKNKNDTFQ